MKKIIVIIATLVLLQLLVVPASFAAPPAQQGGQQGRWNNCSGGCYTVQRGDTLYSIGRRFNVHPRYLAQVNQLDNPDYIYAGQILRIPTDGRYPYPWWAQHDQLRPAPYDMGYGYDRGSDYGAGQRMGNPMSGNGMMGPGPQYGGGGQMMGDSMSGNGMMGPGPQFGGGGQMMGDSMSGNGMMGPGPQFGGGGPMSYGGYAGFNYGPDAGPQYLNAGQPGYGGAPAYDDSGSEN